MYSNMRLTFYIGLSFVLCDVITAETWKENPANPLHGQKLGPLHSVLPVVRFECTGREGGYYGDMDFGCSVFHFCTGDGKRYTFRCSKGLKFNEMTTSCSAGFFGDCTHPEIIGSAGRNMKAEPAPVKSFQNIPIFKGEDNSFEDDPRDYPEPFIQHYDPALDLDYDYYDTEDIGQGERDAQPSASNIMPSSNHLKRDSSWDTSMRSALSAFASLVNIPLDNPMNNAKEQINRMDHQDDIEYVDTIDRAFLARPPPRRSLIQREHPRQFVKLANFKSTAKKPTGAAHFPGHIQNLIPVNPPSLYPVPPTERFNNHEDKFNNVPTSIQYQNIIPYGSEDSFTSAETSIHQTTPDTFRPSSLMTNDPEEFQPVTPKSNSKSTDHIRPYRDANHQLNPGSFSGFQSFSPTPDPFSPTRFPSQTSFGGPPSSQRAINTTPRGFLPPPNFASSGNFVFNQPPIHPAIFNSPFHSASSPTGPAFSRPQAPHTRQNFGHSPDQHTQFIRPPTSHHVPNFERPFGEQTVIRPPTSQTEQTFIHPPGRLHRNSFIHTPNHRPVTSHPLRNFNRHTTPLPPQNFAHQPVQNSFQPQPTSRPIQSFNRPTPASQFIVTTPQPSFGAGNQNPFGIQQERPLLESFPNIAQPPTDFPTVGHSTVLTNHPIRQDLTFPSTSTTRPLVSSLPNIPGNFDFSQEILKESHGQLPINRPQNQGNPPPAFDPRPNRRRRPVTRQSFITQTRRPTSRPLRQHVITNQRPVVNPLVTGLEHSQFNSQFLQPDGRWPGNQGQDSYSSFDDTQLREPGSHQLEDLESNSKVEEFSSDTLQRGTTEKDFSTESTLNDELLTKVENIEDTHNIVVHGNDYDDIDNTPTFSPTTPLTTTTQDTPTELKRPLLRRRPNTRNRLRTRLALRTSTTPEPSQSSENIVVDDTEEILDNSETTNSPTTKPKTLSSTTLSPFRQRIRSRLNLFKNRNRNADSARTTTEAPLTNPSEETDATPESTTVAPTTLTTSRGGLDSDRFQRYRNRLRNRNRNTRTTTKPNISEDNVTQKPSNTVTLLTNLRSRRINPLRSQSSKIIEDDHSKALNPESNEENVLQVKEILNSDQQTDETSQTIIEESLPLLDQKTLQDNAKEESVVSEVFENEPTIPSDEINTDSPATMQENEDDTIIEQEDNIAETSEHTEDRKPANTLVKGRRIINPNFRARFREFIKNRKNRLSASYTTTAAPDEIVNDTAVDVEERLSTSTQPTETSTKSFKERLQQFNQNRQSIRQRFLSNRQANDGERASRRIPLRPLRNKISGARNDDDTQASSDDIVEPDFPEAREGAINFSTSDDHPENQGKALGNPVRVPLNRVTDGFTPALNPIHVKSPMIGHLPVKDVTDSVQRPEIITAPPPTKAGDVVLSMKVSSSLGGLSETITAGQENGELQETPIVKPMQMIVKEIGLESNTFKDDDPTINPGKASDPKEEFSLSESDSVGKSIPDLRNSNENQDDVGSDSSSNADDHSTKTPSQDSTLPLLSKQSDGERYLPEPEEEKYLPEPEGEKYLPEPEEESYLPEPKEDTYLPEPKEETYLPEPEEESYLPEPEEETYLPEPKEETYLPEPKEESYLPEPEEETYLPEPKEETYLPEPEKESYLPEPKADNIDETTKDSENKESHILSMVKEFISQDHNTDRGTQKTEDLSVTSIKDENTEHREAPESFRNQEDDNDSETFPEKFTTLAVSSDTKPIKISRPTFNLKETNSRKTDREPSAISASDYSGELTDNVTPIPLVPITMSTDPPRLPLEMLLPLFNQW